MIVTAFHRPTNDAVVFPVIARRFKGDMTQENRPTKGRGLEA